MKLKIIHFYIFIFIFIAIIFNKETYSNNCQERMYFCTAANDGYFQHLINLIGSLHKTNFDQLEEIAVFDLGLSNNNINYLKKIKKLNVYQIEKTHPDILKPFIRDKAGNTVPGWYAWKMVAIKQSLDIFPYVLWVDAGSTILRPLQDLFSYIQEHGYFIGTIGDEIGTNGRYLHDVWWGATQYVINKFNLNSSENRWILEQETVMGNVIGVKKESIFYDKFFMQMYEFTKDLKNFADDGTTSCGLGTGRHDQILLTILSHLLNFKPLIQDYTQKNPMNLEVHGKDIPFYMTWNPAYVNEKTSIYSSRGDLKNIEEYKKCIYFK